MQNPLNKRHVIESKTDLGNKKQMRLSNLVHEPSFIFFLVFFFLFSLADPQPAARRPTYLSIHWFDKSRDKERFRKLFCSKYSSAQTTYKPEPL